MPSLNYIVYTLSQYGRHLADSIHEFIYSRKFISCAEICNKTCNNTICNKISEEPFRPHCCGQRHNHSAMTYLTTTDWLQLSDIKYRSQQRFWAGTILHWAAYTWHGRIDIISWWRHQMEILSALLAICGGNSPVSGEFPAQRPATRSFDVFFDLCLNKRLSKQSWCWWFETLSRPLWRHSNVVRRRYGNMSACPGWIHRLLIIKLIAIYRDKIRHLHWVYSKEYPDYRLSSRFIVVSFETLKWVVLGLGQITVPYV